MATVTRSLRFMVESNGDARLDALIRQLAQPEPQQARAAKPSMLERLANLFAFELQLVRRDSKGRFKSARRLW